MPDNEGDSQIDFESEVVPEQSDVVYEVEELLATFVQQRPPLWDSRLPLSRRSKTVRDGLWLEIFKEFSEQFSIEFLQRKWRNMRDTFIKVKGEVESYIPSGSATKKRKKVWKYYEIMCFLKDSIIPRKTSYSGFEVLSPTALKNCSSPSTSVEKTGNSEPAAESDRRKATGKKNVDQAILSMIDSIPANKPCPAQPLQTVNPICLRISDLLDKMSQREKTLLEIKLLSQAYEGSKEFL
ncbi:unnamed protein product [Psylliodes chrysocephalus]|uniref:MADF domain-containing protein n=1 Tax=Psylliodes chrysocephalus TaxID=3402493 RepID=A0A9P0G989_9CUCU|nr:unnamed protein product [Psylliodes chrysocephala]